MTYTTHQFINNSLETILKRYSIDHVTGCHNYTGFCNNQGYPIYSKMTLHRKSYEFHKGPIGDLHVMHSCDNPSCINPEHLSLGTHADNMRDKAIKGRVISHRGSKHARSKLNEADILIIRQMKLNKVSRREIATRFNISMANVDDITTRNTWRHVI